MILKWIIGIFLALIAISLGLFIIWNVVIVSLPISGLTFDRMSFLLALEMSFISAMIYALLHFVINFILGKFIEEK